MSSSLFKTVARNTFSGYAKLVVSLISGLVVTPFLIRYLGTSNYGLWTLVLSVVGYTSLLDLGLSPSLVRDVAKRRALDARSELNELVSTFMVVYGGLGAIVLAITVVLAFLFPDVFQLSSDQAGVSFWLVLAVGSQVALSFPLGIFTSVLQGRQRYDVSNGIEIVFAVLRTVFMIAVVTLGYGLVSVALVYICTGLARELSKAVISARMDPDLEFGLRHFRKGRIAEITKVSAYFFIESLGVTIGHQSDEVVIGIFLSTTAVALYDVPLRLIRLVRSVAHQLNAVLLPTATHLDARTENDRLRKVVIEGTKISMAIVLLLVTLLVGLGQSFIELWVGPEFLAGYPVLVVLCYIAVAALAQDTVSTYMMATRWQKIAAIVTVIDMAVNVVLSVVLVLRLGIIGAALGTAIPFTGVTAFNVIFSCRALKLSVWTFLRSAFVAPFLASLPAAAALWAMRTWTYPDSWFGLIWQGVLGGAIYIMAFAAVGFTAAEKQRYYSVVRRRMEVRKDVAS